MSAEMHKVGVVTIMDRAIGAIEAYTSKIVYVGGRDGFVQQSDDRGMRNAREVVAELIDAVRDLSNLYEEPDSTEFSQLNGIYWERVDMAIHAALSASA